MKHYLIPECYTEQAILLILGFTLKNDVNKASGCSSVIAKIKSKYDGRLAIGWIDHDPNKRANRGADYYVYKEHGVSKYKVRVLKKPNSPHYLLEVINDFETWFEPIGNDKGVRKENFGIKYTLHECAKEEIRPNVLNYFKAVVDANPKPFEHLKGVITEIIAKHKE
jgi:hypothetical protein